MRASKWIAAIGVALTIAPIASAHPGHGVETALSGFAHPFSGLDHVAVMVTIGAAALARTRGRVGAAAFVLPVIFMIGMGVGLRAAPFAPDLAAAAELGILASLGVAALVLAAGPRAPLVLAGPLVAACGLAHGGAHAFDAGGAAHPPYVLGVLTATFLLHAIGLALGAALFRRPAGA